MRFWFENKKLEALYTEEKGAHKYSPGLVDAFLDVMSVIAAAVDERDLYKLKGLRYEKLKGDRSGASKTRRRLTVAASVCRSRRPFAVEGFGFLVLTEGRPVP